MNRNQEQPHTVDCFDLPENASLDAVYRLLPKNPVEEYYWERTDRNIGWITRAEQELLRSSIVGIAGTGGMGGLIAQALVRMGVGEIRMADCERFDVSNINRQFGAMRTTIGQSKALATARLIRSISDDTTLVVYPQGITEDTADQFLQGCTIVCDEIEVLAVSARILLHRQARAAGVPLLNCNSVGFCTFLFLFTPGGMTMEELLGMSYEDALAVEHEMRNGSQDACEKITNKMLKGVVPVPPEYKARDWQTLVGRLKDERKASIVGTNPLFAAGFVANRVVLYILEQSGVPRNITKIPEMPGYLYMDAAHAESGERRGRWI